MNKDARWFVLAAVTLALYFALRHPWQTIKIVMYVVLNGREAFAKKMYLDLMKPLDR